MVTEDEIKRQFKTIAGLFSEIESMVVARGRVNTEEFEKLVERWKLTQSGIEYLAGLVRQSPFITVQDEGAEVWLVAKNERVEDAVKGMTPVWGAWKERQ